MNERLKELYLQAHSIRRYDSDPSRAGNPPTVYWQGEVSAQRFAELIVKECLDIIRCDAKNFRKCDIKTDLVVVEEYNKTFKYIKQHFGVEE